VFSNKAALRTWLLAFIWAAALFPVSAQTPPPDVRSPRSGLSEKILKMVRLDQKLGAHVPLDVRLRDENGNSVALRDFFDGKPVLLNLIQYRCTMLCSQEMDVLSQSLHQLKFNIGREFEVVTVSIDHREGKELATAYKKGFVERYGRPGADAGWHFLTGDQGEIRRLADSMGFHFVYDPQTDQYAHPDGLIVLTPEGKIARYFFRLLYPPRDMRLALVEASRGKIGTPLDALALLCYHYNPLTGKYSFAIMSAVRLGAIASTLVLAASIAIMGLRGRSGRKRHLDAEAGEESSLTSGV
jgi:protein SCO1